jgi:hypothetical protein
MPVHRIERAAEPPHSPLGDSHMGPEVGTQPHGAPISRAGTFPAEGRCVHRVRDREHQPTVGLEQPMRSAQHPGEARHVHERHAGHDEVERGGGPEGSDRPRVRTEIGDSQGFGALVPPSEPDHAGRPVDGGDLPAGTRELAREAALTASDIQDAPPPHVPHGSEERRAVHHVAREVQPAFLKVLPDIDVLVPASPRLLGGPSRADSRTRRVRHSRPESATPRRTWRFARGASFADRCEARDRRRRASAATGSPRCVEYETSSRARTASARPSEVKGAPAPARSTGIRVTLRA